MCNKTKCKNNPMSSLLANPMLVGGAAGAATYLLAPQSILGLASFVSPSMSPLLVSAAVGVGAYYLSMSMKPAGAQV
jgi:hypothetical protein